MMKKQSNILLILFFVAIFLQTACREKVTYPETPIIEFKSFYKIENDLGIDQKGILAFSFTDGDGDIGLAESDTLPPYNIESEYYYNLYITYYRKHNGIFLADSLPMTNNGRIMVITPEGKNKAIKGDINVELFINNPKPPSPFDTICFDVFIIDRALNKSNTIRTPDIIVKKQ